MVQGGRVATSNKEMVADLLFFVAFSLSPSPSFAAYLYDWSSRQRVADPVGGAGGSDWYGRDIVAAWQAYNNGYLYFRIDLQSAPSGTIPPGYASTYGIYIDSRDGGAQSNYRYVPGAVTGIGPLSGIDFIVSSEVNPVNSWQLVWNKALQVWETNEFIGGNNLTFRHTENGGTTLEWRIKDGEGENHIGNSFTWWAGTMLPGEGTAKETYDLTRATVTPIPSAAWLLGSGIIGLIGLKRRAIKRNEHQRI